MFIMQVLASQLHFLANRNAELAVPPLFWPVNCIKIEGHVALLSCPSIYFLFHDSNRPDLVWTSKPKFAASIPTVVRFFSLPGVDTLRIRDHSLFIAGGGLVRMKGGGGHPKFLAV